MRPWHARLHAIATRTQLQTRRACSLTRQQTATPPKHATRIDQTHERKHINHRHLAALNCRTHAHVQNLLSLTQEHAQYNRIHTHTHTHTHTHPHTHTPRPCAWSRRRHRSLQACPGACRRRYHRLLPFSGVRSVVCARMCVRACVCVRTSARAGNPNVAAVSGWCTRSGTCLLVRRHGAVHGGGCCGGACARAERESKSTGIQWTPAPRLRRHDRCGSPAAPRPHRASHHTQQFARPGLSASPRT